MKKRECFSHYIFKGSHFEVGIQHGEAFREDIRNHMNMILELAAGNSGLSRDAVLKLVDGYEPFIAKYTPGFIEELKGLSQGAGIEYREALLLQMKQEIVYAARFGNAVPSDQACTSFAFDSTYTCDGKVYSGQNTDQDGEFRNVGNVVTFAVTGKPRIMMLVPAGQISFMGMNELGMSTACNFLPCTGWKTGFPRYLLSRYMLEQKDFDQACLSLERINSIASSRNILLADHKGHMVNYEILPVGVGETHGNGSLIHTNHFVHPEMAKYEKSNPYEMEDSLVRYQRFTELSEDNKGKIDLALIQAFLRDHGDHPCYSICMHPSLHNTYRTMASLVFDLTDRVMYVAAGNPCQSRYQKYTFEMQP